MQNYIGKQIDRYRIIERLGKGGMAVVYKAYDVRLEREVALKLIRTEAIPQEQHDRLLKRFEREAKAMARFAHPNIVSVHDYGEVDGRPYLVMAYLPGSTLKARIDGPMPVKEALKIVIPIADALAYAHELGVVHRDVKPSNILFTPGGVPVLTDFGIAKILKTDEATLTGTGLGVGTPEYMAPEQWQGKASEATDQYALGVVLYELLTGEKPYTADTPVAIALKQATEPLPRPSSKVKGISESLEQVLYKVLAKEPGDRYADMAAFQMALTVANVETVERTAAKPEASARPQPAPTAQSEGATVDDLETPRSSAEVMGQLEVGKKSKTGLIWIVGAVVVSIVLLVVLWPRAGKEVPELANVFTDKPTENDKSESTTEQPSVTVTFTPESTATTRPTLTATLGIGSTKINAVDGAEMVYVPAGEFLMGNDNGYSLDERPQHVVYLDSYWIYKYEVTNQQYRACIEANICSGSFDIYLENQKPAIHISWNEAETYCLWVGGDLPSEAEWEKAARGTDGRVYPWGDDRPNCKYAQVVDCPGEIVPVGSFPDGASPYGALDMVGNVSEWVADWYEKNYYWSSPQENPKGPTTGVYKVIRGGSWDSWGNQTYSRDSSRSRLNNVGFRCRIIESQ